MENGILSPEEQEMINEALKDIEPTETSESSTDTETIKENSKSLLVDDHTSRFSSAIWYENIQKKVITLAGCGGIGSYVGFLLARMKPNLLFLFDDDTVETVNMSGQLYDNNSIGRKKVNALSSIIDNFSDYKGVFATSRKFTEAENPTDIMICGFDNMVARKTFFTKWLDLVNSKSDKDTSKCLFIDGRLSAEEFQIFCITGDDTYNIKRYQEEFLFKDEEAEETLCSYKQTSFCANMIASCIVNLFVNFCANEEGAYREIPFITKYNAELMYFKTES